jgi:hypothetical protein
MMIDAIELYEHECSVRAAVPQALHRRSRPATAARRFEKDELVPDRLAERRAHPRSRT